MGYLAMLSNQYGLHSTTVKLQIKDWLSNLDLRIIAIEKVYRYLSTIKLRYFQKLIYRNLISYLEILKYTNLNFYKLNLTKQVFRSKSNKQPIKLVFSTHDFLVQTLFMQLLNPIIDVHVDFYNFGYRKRRNLHQAVHILNKILILKFKQKSTKNSSQNEFSYKHKYIVKLKIKNSFDNLISNNKWLLKNYPFPTQYNIFIKYWLLNSNNKSSSKIKKTFNFCIVRYVDKLIIVINTKTDIKIFKKEIKLFFLKRGLKFNSFKLKIYKWGINKKFNYLGFTFHLNLKKTKTTSLQQFNKHNNKYGIVINLA